MPTLQKNDNDTENFNPGDKNYKDTFRNLSEDEIKNAGKTSSDLNPDNNSEQSVQDYSKRGGLYNPSISSLGPNKFMGILKLSGKAKKGGPIAAIVSIFIIAMITLFSPAGLLIHLKETMVGKFNQQLASMDIRTRKMIDAKTKEATKGFCNGPIKVKCKYSTMSDRQLKKFKAAGFDVDTEKTTLGRNKIKSISYNGESIAPEDFKTRMISDPEFRRAVKTAYNPKFAGFADNIWKKIKTRFGISERAPKTAKDVDERKKVLHENSKTPFSDPNSKNKYPKEGEPHPLCDNPQSCTKVEEDNKALKNQIDEYESRVKNLTGKFSPGKITSSSIRALGIVGAVDSACSVYAAIQLTAFAAKNIRMLQLIRYSVQFFTVADMIKAGDAKPEDVSQIGTILTSNSPGDYSDEIKGPRKSATDSFGYKYAAYGDTSKMSDQTSVFLAGGGLNGTLSSVSGKALEVIGGKENAKTTCRFLANPFVQAGSLVLGIAFSIIPGIGWAKLGASIAIAGATALALGLLPGILADIIAGNITENIQGEDSGDAITSGSGALMGSLANTGGNAPLSKDQALAYNKLNQETTIAYLKDEASQLSPFDTSNKYTFMGSIFSSLVPYYSKQAFSLSGGINTSLSLVGSSFASIIPKSSAVSDAQISAAMDICQDYDYKDMGIATDPFCNPMFGIPPEYLEADPFDVIDYLRNSNYIDNDGNKTESYNNWIRQCTERDYPFGYSDVEDPNSPEEGKSCLINNKETAYLYIGLIDSRIEEGMDDSGV